MIRIIRNENTKLDKRLNGKYYLLYFGASGLGAGTGENLLFFKFEEEVNTDIVGNGHFTADGYLYDKYNNTMSNFTYRPENATEMQILEFKNVKNCNLSFFDRDKNAINIPIWTIILKKV